MEATKYVAFGVPDVDEAAGFYRDSLGFKEIGRPEGCVALTSGPLTLMICLDDGNSPCFNLSVDDIEAAEKTFVTHGGEVYLRIRKEVFVKDQYGHCWCLTPKKVFK